MKNQLQKFILLSIALLFSSTIILAQENLDEAQRNKAIALTDSSLYYNSLGNIDQAIQAYKDALTSFELVKNKTREDSTTIGIIYTNSAIYYDYQNSGKEVIQSLESAYNFFHRLSEPKNDKEKVNQINTLKILLYHLLSQENYSGNEKFDFHLSHFVSSIEMFKNDKQRYLGYNHYLGMIQKSAEAGFSEFDKIVFDSERYSVQSQLMQNDSIKYKCLKNSLESMKKLVVLSDNNERRAINTHLVMLLGQLSYRGLFQNDFEFAEKCAKEGLALKMNQWWIATNLVHALYLQGRLYDARDVYYQFDSINHTDGNSLGTLIKNDIKVLQSKGVCDHTYLDFIENLDQEINIIFPKSTYPIVPILKNGKSQIKTTANIDADSYKWVHKQSGREKKGKSVDLDRAGEWILSYKDNSEEGILDVTESIYVDNFQTLKYLDIYLLQSGFVPYTIYRKKTWNINNPSMSEISFSEDSDEFVNIDSAANHVLKNFKILKDLKGGAVVISNMELSSGTLENYQKQFNSHDAGLFIILNFNEKSRKGKMYLKAKDVFERFPILSEDPNYNQLFHMQNILPEIIAGNDTMTDIVRVVLSNMFMGHPIGGFNLH